MVREAPTLLLYMYVSGFNCLSGVGLFVCGYRILCFRIIHSLLMPLFLLPCYIFVCVCVQVHIIKDRLKIVLFLTCVILSFSFCCAEVL